MRSASTCRRHGAYSETSLKARRRRKAALIGRSRHAAIRRGKENRLPLRSLMPRQTLSHMGQELAILDMRILLIVSPF